MSRCVQTFDCYCIYYLIYTSLHITGINGYPDPPSNVTLTLTLTTYPMNDNLQLYALQLTISIDKPFLVHNPHSDSAFQF
jgi:hypothetical protein